MFTPSAKDLWKTYSVSIVAGKRRPPEPLLGSPPDAHSPCNRLCLQHFPQPTPLLTRIKQDCYEYPECSQQDFYPPPPSVSADNNNGLGAVGGVAGVQDPAAVRREANRLQQRRRLANESPDKRAARLESQRIQQQLRLASESAEQRAARLLALRERQRFRLAHESPNQRAARLTALRERQRIRLATESNDQRAKRLEALRFFHFLL